MTTAGKTILVIVAIVLAGVCFVTGLLIGWFLLEEPMTSPKTSNSTTASSPRLVLGASSADAQYDRYKAAMDRVLGEADPTVSERLLEEIQPSNIEEHLRFVSEMPHLAGTDGDQRTVEYVQRQFEDMGYDVKLYPYDVLLSYPADEHFNRVSMLDGRGTAIFTSGVGAKTGSVWDGAVTEPYCMYSPSGVAKGKLVYANYGRPQDFKVLDRLGVDPEGTIVIMRYGKLSRGRKLREAAKRGGLAVLLYNDPADVNVNATRPDVYPATWWLPGTDVEHGNVRTASGDPATPGHAATEGAYRIPESEMDLPTIPCHPVSYNDARDLLRNLEGNLTAPDNWQGALGIVYRVASNKPGALPVEVTVKNVLETRRVYNVIATLRGAVEPDRVVLVGNHRDAIAYGALDPGSGTAVMLEMARAFGALAHQGWRPRRSMTFCSWAAEEFGLIGSTEWVEDKRRWLSDHAVAYLNLDTVLQGNYTFDMSATPSLKAAAVRAASKVPDPHNRTRTVLDTWRHRVVDDRSPGQPWIRRPVSFTDLQPFVHLVGVPVTHSRYSFVEEGDLIYHVRNYPLYHSVYDTMRLAAMMDPTFAVSAAVAGVVGEMARDLAEAVLLPLSPRDYAADIATHLKEPMAAASEHSSASVVHLQAALDEFSRVAENLHNKIENFVFSDPFEIQQLNNKLILFEREFVDHGTHLFLSYGSNSKPSIDQKTMSAMAQALRAAAASLSS